MYLPYILALLLIAYIVVTEQELDRQRKKARKAYIAGYERGIKAEKNNIEFYGGLKMSIDRIAAHLNSLIKSLEEDYESEREGRLKAEKENRELKAKLKAMDGQIWD